MSGTGNSFSVAKDIAAGLEKNGNSASVHNIENLFDIKLIKQANSIGVVFPTHGFTLPWMIFKFLILLPRGRSRYAFTVCTRGSIRIGKFFMPGLGGSANAISALILFLKGYKPKAWKAIDMPSNWTVIHPSLTNKSCNWIYKREKKKIDSFVPVILQRKWSIITLNNSYDFLLGALLLKISIIYFIFARFFLTKMFFANEKCNSCGLCEKQCPVGAIKMRGTKKPVPYWKLRCESCMRCISFCPQKGIESGHSWAFVLYLASAGYGLPYLFAKYIIPNYTHQWWFFWLSIALTIPGLVIAYHLFHYLMRIKIFNKIFSFTTFTRIFKKYRHSEVKVTDFKKELNTRE